MSRRTPRPLRVLHLTPEFPPVIWGGLGTAVGGLVNASARAGMTVGVLLVGGVLVLDQHRYGGVRDFSEELLTNHWRKARAAPGNVTFFHISPHDAVNASIRLAREW